MRTALNILWFVLGGWLLALVWFAGAVVMAISVIGLPWSRACFEIAKLSLSPFGREVVNVSELEGGSDLPMGLFRLIANLIWLPFGILLAISHITHGVAMFITIIGIPLAIQDFKLAGISLFPVGKRVVMAEVADAARAANAAETVKRWRQ